MMPLVGTLVGLRSTSLNYSAMRVVSGRGYNDVGFRQVFNHVDLYLVDLHFPILPNQTAILDCEHRTRSGDGDIRCDWFVVASHTIR
jgi:hypothetical protein